MSNTMNIGSGAGGQSNLFVVYNKLGFLSILRSALVFEPFTMPATLPRGMGHTARWIRYSDLTKVTTPLLEGENPAPHAIANPSQIDVAIDHYGAFIRVGEKLDLTKPSGTQQQYVNILGRQAKESMNSLVQTELLATSTIVRCGGQGDSSLSGAAAGSSTTLSLRDLARLRANFKNVNALPHMHIGRKSMYPLVIDPLDTFDLQSSAAQVSGQADVFWTDVAKYVDNNGVLSGSPGAIMGVVMVETNEIDTVSDSSQTVRRCIAIADEGIGALHLSGKSGIELKNKRPGPTSTDNPLDQFQTFGWKLYYATKLLDSNRVIKLYTRVV